MTRACLLRVEKALSYSGGTHAIYDVLDMIRDGHAQLWESNDAVIVTEIHEYPRQRVLHFWLASGEMSAVLSLQEDCIQWARSQGITRATLAGRKGWTRALRDTWKPSLVLMERDI